jgi:hypothetical protein
MGQGRWGAVSPPSLRVARLTRFARDGVYAHPMRNVKVTTNVLPLVKNASNVEDFWAGCTLGEVYLLQRDIDSAAAKYQRVIDRHPAKVGGLAGTRQQAKRICAAHKLSEEDTKKVLTLFELLDG